MKIKLIDLLKLMLERKAPNKIEILGFTMTFFETDEWGNYEDKDHYKLSDFRILCCLNEDVKIIEEHKKISELPKSMIIWKGNEILGITGATLSKKYYDYYCIKIFGGNDLDYELEDK